MPPLCCDCHAHICGPANVYPYAPERIYTPPDALLPDYLKMLSVLGVQRTVFVQPSVYGTDNTVMLESLARCQLPSRGVAVLDNAVSDKTLARLHAAGVRGVRFNRVDIADSDRSMALGQMRALSQRIAALGWHAEFLIHVDAHPDLEGLFGNWPVDIVFGHMGYVRPGESTDNPGFKALLRLMRRGRCWVKLTGPYRIASGDLPYEEASSFAAALLEAAPERVVWGTDWPHVMMTRAMPNDGDLCDLLLDWIPDSQVRKRVLVINPGVLYEFDETRITAV